MRWKFSRAQTHDAIRPPFLCPCSRLTRSVRLASPIFSVNPAYEGKLICKMGIFPRIPQPEAEGFSLHRHDWQGIHPGVTQYKTKTFGEKMDE